uniref:Uncharacterized protein n=1 Tax=Arundo donax TaxID=35708 RepID=A0A0A9DYY1_ARUDO
MSSNKKARAGCRGLSIGSSVVSKLQHERSPKKPPNPDQHKAGRDR